MQKIYTLARVMINFFLEELVRSGKLSPKSATFKTTLVKEEMVTFLVHDDLKKLMEKQLKIRKPRFAECYFLKNDHNYWLVTVEAHGAESFFFARQLQRIASGKTTRGKNFFFNLNKNFLDKIIEEALRKSGSNPEFFKRKIEFERFREYSVILPINGTTVKFHNESVDLLARNISQQVPGFLKIISEAK